MWFDLALALGDTVTSLRRRMPASEFAAWTLYVQLYGPIDYARRYDYPAAMVSWMSGRTYSGRVDELMPYRLDPVDAPAGGWSDIDQKLLRMADGS